MSRHGSLATRKLLATIWRPRQSLLSRAQQKVLCAVRPFSAGCLWRPRQSLVFRTPQVAHAPVGNAKHSVTLTKYHTVQHCDAACTSATQLFNTNISTLMTQKPEPTSGTIGQEAQSGLSLSSTSLMTHADELDVLTTMLEDTADNQTIQPHGDQSELRPHPEGQARGHTRERVPRRPPHSSPWTLKVTYGGCPQDFPLQEPRHPLPRRSLGRL